ncbi:MAG: DNA gyrase C-terminal beta-propeller domain-containing protein, partial [Lachnospiraceae bacterium]|nr:DNA gyrase C-terminal beta-propeller domain-containing protein [Lachnospiraceae bacterium]
ELIEVRSTNNKKDILLVTRYGQCIRFNENDVRKTGRVSMGVIGINLTAGDEVVAMQMNTEGEYLLIVSEKGMGKLTPISEFTPQNRGGKGVKCYKIMEKTGNVVGAKAVNIDNEILIINTEGILIRMMCSDISILGRVTSGVKLMDLKSEKDIVAGIAKVRESIDKADKPEDMMDGSEKGSLAEVEEEPLEADSDEAEDLAEPDGIEELEEEFMQDSEESEEMTEEESEVREMEETLNKDE